MHLSSLRVALSPGDVLEIGLVLLSGVVVFIELGHSVLMAESVSTWFENTSNPLAPVMKTVRAIIVEHPDVTEVVKYRAPAFEYDGIMCYFNWSAKKRASLIFPTGRTIPGHHPDLEDGSNLQRMMYFECIEDVDAKADSLRDVIDAYITSR